MGGVNLWNDLFKKTAGLEEFSLPQAFGLRYTIMITKEHPVSSENRMLFSNHYFPTVSFVSFTISAAFFPIFG